MAIRNLLDAKTRQPVVIEEGESRDVVGQCVDLSGNPLPLTSLLTFTVTLYNEADNAIINTKNAQDAKNLNGHTVATDGAYVIRLEPLDNVIVVETPAIAEGALQYHILRLIWTWNDGVSVRTGIDQLRLAVQKLEVTV